MAKVKISCDEMVARVVNTFVRGADEVFLKKVAKTAKGTSGFFSFDIGKHLYTSDKQYALFVQPPFLFFMKSKDVYFIDEANKTTYRMTPSSDWKKFYEAVLAAIDAEKANVVQ